MYCRIMKSKDDADRIYKVKGSFWSGVKSGKQEYRNRAGNTREDWKWIVKREEIFTMITKFYDIIDMQSKEEKSDLVQWLMYAIFCKKYDIVMIQNFVGILKIPVVVKLSNFPEIIRNLSELYRRFKYN